MTEQRLYSVLSGVSKIGGIAALWVVGSVVSAAPLQAVLEQVAQDAPACKAAQPFYWEVGNKQGVQASGQAGDEAPNANTEMPIASATKWLFGAYVAEMRQGQLTDSDKQALTMQAGYVNYKHRLCVKVRQSKQDALTVADCFAESGPLAGHNDALTATAVGKFYYAGGHFQHWGAENGLGQLNDSRLAQTFNERLGPDLGIGFESPQLAGGARMSASHYGRFLRKLMRGELRLGALLGANAVCAQPAVCPQQALKSPIPSEYPWNYSLGHWVETGATGDGSFSSAGAFGFYPWISADKQTYGIVARMKKPGLRKRPAQDSVACGQQIRAAWRSMSGE